MEIRRSYDRLISTMGFPILVRRHLYIESGPCSPVLSPAQRIMIMYMNVHPILDTTKSCLTHWSSVTIYASVNLVSIDSINGLLPDKICINILDKDSWNPLKIPLFMIITKIITIWSKSSNHQYFMANQMATKLALWQLWVYSVWNLESYHKAI